MISGSGIQNHHLVFLRDRTLPFLEVLVLSLLIYLCALRLDDQFYDNNKVPFVRADTISRPLYDENISFAAPSPKIWSVVSTFR